MKNNILTIFLAVVFGIIFSICNSFAAVLWTSTSPLPSAYVGIPYSYQLQATSSTFSSIIYLVSSGNLPGLTVSPSGLISGTVTAPGTASVSILASDGDVSSGPVSRVFSITYLDNTGITGPLRIKRLQISFDNNRPEKVISRNETPPSVSADVSYTGSGLLKGYWTVDGVVHSQIHRTLSSNANVVLRLPAVPPLPTYQTGTHRVGLVITEPNIGPIPDITYFVKQDEIKAFEPIKVISPADMETVAFEQLTLNWYMQSDAVAYLVEFREEEENDPLFSAYTRKTMYNLPRHSLKNFFSTGKTYFWTVKGLSKDDKILNESVSHRFTFN